MTSHPPRSAAEAAHSAPGPEAPVPPDTLTRIFGSPLPHVRTKVSPVLHEWAQTFVAASPFVVLASSDANGNHDASPRGGPPGFCRVLDAHTIAIPEQPGNNLLQTIRNVNENPGIALLFLIPGVTETARVNGIAEFVLSKSPAWNELSDLWADGEQLRGAILIHVKEAYYHCGRAGKFARLWDVEAIRENAVTRPVPKRPARPPTTPPSA